MITSGTIARMSRRPAARAAADTGGMGGGAVLDGVGGGVAEDDAASVSGPDVAGAGVDACCVTAGLAGGGVRAAWLELQPTASASGTTIVSAAHLTTGEPTCGPRVRGR